MCGMTVNTGCTLKILWKYKNAYILKYYTANLFSVCLHWTPCYRMYFFFNFLWYVHSLVIILHIVLWTLTCFVQILSGVFLTFFFYLNFLCKKTPSEKHDRHKCTCIPHNLRCYGQSWCQRMWEITSAHGQVLVSY